MANPIQNIFTQPEAIRNDSISLCDAEVPDQLAKDAIDAIISRLTSTFFDLIKESKEKPELIMDYKSSLTKSDPAPRTNMYASYINRPSNYNAITRWVSDVNRISIFTENNEFDENQPIDKARIYIRLRINAKDINDADPLDNLLRHLSNKILREGYGENGTFDIRLEKGYFTIEGDSGKWHYDGTGFKTSITVCFSNKKNWTTHVSETEDVTNGKPAIHGFLYDALNVYHRAPIRSDINNEEITSDDYRLFIRYNEFYTNQNIHKKSDQKLLEKETTDFSKFFETSTDRKKSFEKIIDSPHLSLNKLTLNSSLSKLDMKFNLEETPLKPMIPPSFDFEKLTLKPMISPSSFDISQLFEKSSTSLFSKLETSE